MTTLCPTTDQHVLYLGDLVVTVALEGDRYDILLEVSKESATGELAHPARVTTASGEDVELVV